METAADMFCQSLPGNFGPHPRRILNRPAILTIWLGFEAAPFEFRLDRGLIKILNRHREMSHVRLIVGMLALTKVKVIFAKLQETNRPPRSIHAENAARFVIDEFHAKQAHIKIPRSIDVRNVLHQVTY